MSEIYVEVFNAAVADTCHFIADHDSEAAAKLDAINDKYDFLPLPNDDGVVVFLDEKDVDGLIEDCNIIAATVNSSLKENFANQNIQPIHAEASRRTIVLTGNTVTKIHFLNGPAR